MREVTIGQERETIRFNYKDTSFDIPLASSLPLQELTKFRSGSTQERYNNMIAFLEQYIPLEVYAAMTSGELMQVIKAWSSASEEVAGVTPGE